MSAPDLSRLRDEFADYLYSQVPEEWRRLDRFNQKQFYRYLQIVQDGGFKYMITEMDFILTFTDPVKCPEKFLPILFASFGFPYFYDIPVQYQRRFIQNLVWLYKTKGTTPCIEYLARELSGYDAVVDVTGWGDYDILIRIMVDPDGNQLNPAISVVVLERLLEYFLPVYSRGKVMITYIDEEDIWITDHVDEFLKTKVQTMTEEFIIINRGCIWTDRRYRYTDNGYFASPEELANMHFHHTFIDDEYDVEYFDIIDHEEGWNPTGRITDMHFFGAKWTDRGSLYTNSATTFNVPSGPLLGGRDQIFINGELVETIYN